MRLSVGYEKKISIFILQSQILSRKRRPCCSALEYEAKNYARIIIRCANYLPLDIVFRQISTFLEDPVAVFYGHIARSLVINRL